MCKRVSRRSIGILLFALVFPAPSWAMGKALDRGYRYEAEAGKCVNPSGVEGRSPGFAGPCGDLTAPGEAKLNSVLSNWASTSPTDCDLSGIRVQGLDLSGATEIGSLKCLDLRGASLLSTHLEGLDLSLLRLRGAVFDGSFLAGVNLEAADLRGAKLDATQGGLANTLLKGAAFDSSTRLPFGCDQAKALGMSWVDADQFGCDHSPPELVQTSQGFQTAYPGIHVVWRPSASTLYLYDDRALRVTPVDPGGAEAAANLTLQEQGEILCAAFLKDCLRSGVNSILENYQIQSLPEPAIEWGLVLYHAPLATAVKLKRLRVVSVFELAEDPARKAAVRAEWSQLALAAVAEWKTSNGTNSLPVPAVVSGGLLQFSDRLDLALGWAPGSSSQGAALSCQFERRQDGVAQNPRCLLRMDLYPPVSGDPDWAEETINTMIRQAELETLTLSLTLGKSLAAVFNGNPRISIPLKNMDSVTLAGPSVDAKPDDGASP